MKFNGICSYIFLYWKLLLIEYNYDIYNKKLLAIVVISKVYAEGLLNFTIFIEYKNLKTL